MLTDLYIVCFQDEIWKILLIQLEGQSLCSTRNINSDSLSGKILMVVR